MTRILLRVGIRESRIDPDITRFEPGLREGTPTESIGHCPILLREGAPTGVVTQVPPRILREDWDGYLSQLALAEFFPL